MTSLPPPLPPVSTPPPLRLPCLFECLVPVSQGKRLRMNWASKPKSVTGDEALLGDFTYPKAVMPSPALVASVAAGGGGGGGGAGGPGVGAPGGPGGAGGGAGGGGAMREAYPGQSLGLPPPPGFMMHVTGPAGAGPIRTDTRGARPPPPFYPSMNPLAMGARLPTN